MWASGVNGKPRTCTARGFAGILVSVHTDLIYDIEYEQFVQPNKLADQKFSCIGQRKGGVGFLLSVISSSSPYFLSSTNVASAGTDATWYRFGE